MVLLYVTASSRDEARKIGRTLVEERLAACVNILDKMVSIYHWRGKIEEANEIVLLVKTREELFPKAEKRIKELHSYDNPCVIQIPVTNGSKEYLDWVEESTY